MSSPTTENKYVCPHCFYSAIVAGKRYFEPELDLYLGTRECKSCNRLFDSEVTLKATDEARKVQIEKFNADYPENSNDPFGKSFSYFGDYLARVECEEKKQVSCTWCGSRKSEKWSGDNPICPKCNSEMQINNYEYSVYKSSDEFSGFSEMINSAPKVVLCLVFPECAFCRQTRNMVAEVLHEKPNEFRFIEISVDYAEMNDLIFKYKLNHVPTFLLYKNGKFIGKFRKIISKVDLEHKIIKKFETKL